MKDTTSCPECQQELAILEDGSLFCVGCGKEYSKHFLENLEKVDDIEIDITQFFEGKDLKPELLGNHLLRISKFLTLKDNEEIYVYKNGIYENSGEVSINEYCKKNIPEITEHEVREVIFHIKSLTYRDREVLNSEKGLIWVKNGIIDVMNGNLMEFTPEMISTMKLPVMYDKDADCHKFKKFLSEVLLEGDIPVIQEWGGFCLLNDYRFHKALMLIGSGSNGKSTYLNVNQKFLGEKNTCSVSLSELSYNRFAPSRLFGKMANIFADIPATRLLFTGNFKMSTGEDRLPYEKKHRDSGEFRNTAKQMFSANQLPQTDDVTDAFFRRWIIVNFPKTFDNETADKELLEKLTTDEELSGILNFYLEGLKRLLENGSFSYSKTQDEVKSQYIMLSDSLRSFALSQMIKGESEEYITVDTLFERYQDYCDDNGLEVKSKNLIGRELPTILPFVHRGNTKREGHQTRVWFNLKFNITDITDKKGINYNIQSHIPYDKGNKCNICNQNDDNDIEEEDV